MPEKIKLYLDQMLQAQVARILSDDGFDVLRASETGQSRADDEQIMNKAIDDNRILITLDEHFGDWAILPLSRHPGVIRLKVNPTTSDNILRILLPFLRRLLPDKIENHLVILSSSREKWISTE